ncbi:MAG: hypothetical protein GTO12_14865 [Proteobacteria bacterium]|nr:hypothetical protein [Pseudomonadota bacterium]
MNIIGPHNPNVVRRKFARFEISTSEGNDRVLKARSAPVNSYVDFAKKEALKWRDYEFSGKMKITDAYDSIGVTFYSQPIFPDGTEWYYRLRRYGGEDFYIDPKGTQITRGRIASGVFPQPGRWYRFRIRVYNTDAGTHIKAKVWQDDGAEPLEWNIDCIDDSIWRSTGGTIGVWTRTGKGEKLFDDFEVVELIGRQRGKVLLREDFENVTLEDEIWVVRRLRETSLPEAHFNILLAHAPDIIKNVATERVELVVAGHTHGGQVRLPFIGALYARTSLGREFAAGLFEFSGTALYVTRGIGTSFIPFRFLCRPEITVFHLKTN